ncbi:helicase-related protein [Tenacibaculum finnmarkense]|uniref:helicase-related protein n=1 Tax=Tenacibaculum finnmarkense TaxID=2781243 RepID=UPI001EFBDD23|nr:helicase-related protein [Tenacibaculum finnmarkense]MCG8803954.1 helicase [Tenacibaculum finnmarkense]MCG8826680.1 helicase [Tenacibaculum finnmarkense]
MSNNHDNIARDIFQARIKKGLLGPGSDIFVNEKDKNEEIISDYPLQRYYTGVLFPEQIKKDTAESEVANETESDDEDPLNEQIEEKEPSDKSFTTNNKGDNKDDELKISQNTFFPSNIGLTFCVDNGVKELDIEFSFGLYSQVTSDIKIKVSKRDFDEFNNHSSFPFKKIISYEDGYMILKRKLQGKSRTPRTEEFAQFDDFKKSDGFKDSPLPPIFHNFEKLIGRTWKRENIVLNEKISVSDISKPKTIFERNLKKKTSDYLRVSYTLKTYHIKQNPNNTYVKIQLANTSDKHPSNQFSNAKELLNQKCIFQAKIKANSNELSPYKSYLELNPLDKEAEVLNYLYKDKLSYGIGHNCSVIWDKKKKTIQTSFLPEYDVKDTKNSFSQEDFKDNPNDFHLLNKSLDIYSLSHFSNENKNEIIERLKTFVNLYGNWISKQKKTSSSNKEIENHIFKNLDYNLNRLRLNIELLNDGKIFRAFQLANSAMLIQIILSNDDDFSGKEKDLSELNSTIDYDNINYFKNYNFDKLSFGKPKYRPFQLAFLLLNLENGLNDSKTEERRKIVDLIWFPTGGGKTEAYLSVGAFTIIYRRLMNKTGYDGTSVIMRYTLRLLTAQQFERASRLIVSLEFLRNQFEQELREEPITIGMWVGMSSTPNSLKEAEEKVEDLNEECNKKDGIPDNKNVFQISSCSWCGTKLITKNELDNWTFGFKIEGKKKDTKFKIRCVNKKCHFHKELPIQVVDEMLYDKPPTLLFGTVDKFAMLAWKAQGNSFFNSLNDSLPPDLIIQDELHLLTGPLGTITGIFESVIEILCSKNGRKPKIISSTATTRNTNEQIKALYGNDKIVNVFPPSGLSYSDSFFAKVSTTKSTRRYIGFIPTGKSSIDTQLQMLANLFVARLEVYKKLILNGVNDYEIFDKYWTLISYYNSLKDVGKIHNKVGDEISTFTSALQKKLYGDNPNDKFNHVYLYNRDEELTSRIDSTKIKQTLKRLEENKFDKDTIQHYPNGNTYVKSGIIDLVLATNMISVGIDIERFNVMLINSQPKNVAEYIQASSRVGRKYKGLVIDLLDANRARDKSHFEHFIPFHQAFYKSVEPVSLTPFTENTLEKMLASIMITYVRHKIPGMASNNSAQYFQPVMLDGLKTEMKKRYSTDSKVYKLFENKLKELSDDWLFKINDPDIALKFYEHKTEPHLLLKPAEKSFDNGDDLWSVMQSMREIDTNSFIKVGLPNIRKNG